MSGFVYEVLKVDSGKPVFLKEHMDRLLSSLKKYTKREFDVTIIDKAIKNVIDSSEEEKFNIKVVLNTENFEYELSKYIGDYPNEAMYENGVTLATHMHTRKDPNVKYLNKDLTKKMSEKKDRLGVYQMLYTDDNYVLECEKANIFFIKDDSFYTSPDSDVLLGVTRKKVLELAEHLNIKIVKKKIKIKELPDMDSAFITGTSIDVLPVSRIDSISFETNTHLLKKFREEFAKIVYGG